MPGRDEYPSVAATYYLGNSGSLYQPFAEYQVARYEQENDPKVFECVYCGNVYSKQPLSCPGCSQHWFISKHMSDLIVPGIG